MTKSKAAFLLSARALAKTGPLYFWTFTFKEVLAIKATRKKWNHLLTLFLRSWPSLQGLRVFELHEDHGLHVHTITNSYLNVNQARALAEQAGWGRIHVQAIPSNTAGYLGKYLSAKRPPCLRGWRLWAAFGKGWAPTRAKDIKSDCLFTQIYQNCKIWRRWEGRGDFFKRMTLVRKLLMKTIEEDWHVGCGPGGKAYSLCTLHDLGLCFADVN
jgi:hypothetical protein